MTIAKKLYMGFGAILVTMLALFILNIFTVRREYNVLALIKGAERVRFERRSAA